MPQRSGKPKASRSPADDANWYASPEGRRQTQREFSRALKNGTLIRSAGAAIPPTDPKVLQELMEQAKQSTTRPVSLRIPSVT
jgi:hypothetical protein